MKQIDWKKILLLVFLVFWGGCQEAKRAIPQNDADVNELAILSQGSNVVEVEVRAKKGATGRMTITVRGGAQVHKQLYLNKDTGPPWRKSFVLPENRLYYLSATLRLPNGQRKFLTGRGRTKKLQRESLYKGPIDKAFILASTSFFVSSPSNELLAIDTLDGSIGWKETFKERPNLLLHAKGTLFLNVEKTLLAFSGKDGNLLWKKSLKSAPTIARFARKSLFLFSEKERILSLAQSGKVQWQRSSPKFTLPFLVSPLGFITVGHGFYDYLVIDGPTGARGGNFELFALERMACEPILRDEELIVGLRNGKVLVGAPQRQARIEIECKEEIWGLCANKSTLFIASNKSMTAYDLEKEVKTWSQTLGKVQIKAIECTDKLLVYQLKDSLIVLDAANGLTLAELKTGKRFFRLNEGEVYFVNQNGELSRVTIGH